MWRITMGTINRASLCTSVTFMLGLVVGLVIGHPDLDTGTVLNPYHIIVVVVATTMFHLTQIIPKLLTKKSE